MHPRTYARSRNASYCTRPARLPTREVAPSAVWSRARTPCGSVGRDEVDRRLQTIMSEIHRRCVQHGEEKGGVNYVADAMLAYGVV